MANKTSTTKKKSVAIRVFNILFIVALVIAIVVPILMFTPLAHSLKGSLQNNSWAAGVAKNLNNFVKYHVCDVFHLSRNFRGHGWTFTSCLYIYLLALVALGGLFMIYLPFVVIHMCNNKGKTEKWRKIVLGITAGVITLTFAAMASLMWSPRLSKDMGGAYTWIVSIVRGWTSLFKSGHAFNVLVVERITWNTYIWAGLWGLFFLALIEFIVLLVCYLVKAKEKVTVSSKEEVNDALADAEASLVPQAAVMAASTASENEENGKIIPTIREVALLDSLNPLYDTKIDTLPELGSDALTAVSEIEEPAKEALEENKEIVDHVAKASENINVEDKKIVVLPGIDEWNASPWDDEIKTEESNVTETDKEDVTIEAAPVDENVPVEEIAVTETIESEKEVTTESAQEESSSTEETVVEEVQLEDSNEEKSDDTIEENASEEKTIEEKEEQIIETVSEAVEEFKTAETPDEVIEEKSEEVNEEKVVEETASEEKPLEVKEENSVEEKPVTSAPRVNQIGLKTFDPTKREKPKNVGVINPVKTVKEEPVEEKPAEVNEEKAKVTPIVAPLHSIEKSKHEKIEAVKARKVSFELKNYQVKTYEGDLTSEEAFNMGVTKVQPTVNPIFANQSKEPAWKEKRRQEEIKKNGYGDVTSVEKLNGKTTSTTTTGSKKVVSIRDLVKAKKSQENIGEETKNEETKIVKPIAPVAFKAKEEPVKEETKEETPLDVKSNATFHPIAPIQHKPTKRPDIKLVDPMKSKNSK